MSKIVLTSYGFMVPGNVEFILNNKSILSLKFTCINDRIKYYQIKSTTEI